MKTNKFIELPDFAKNLIQQILKDEKLTEFNIICELGSNDGDGVMANITRAIIKGHKNNEPSELRLIVKTQTDETDKAEINLTKLLFEREILTYQQYLPAIVEFQQKNGLSTHDRFLSFPKCYGMHYDCVQNAYCLILEDLKARQFTLWNCAQPIQVEHVRMVLREMAKFHGLAFALQDQYPAIYKPFEQLDELILVELNMQIKIEYKDAAINRAIKTLDPEIDVKAIEKMIQLRDNYKEHLLDCVSKDILKTVMNHGDIWNNNIMYSYEDMETQKNLNDISLIDWQFLRFGSPVLDLVFFLFMTTDKPLRDQHYHNLINYYYEILAKTIKLTGSDPQILFSFEDLQNHLKRYGKFALMKAPILIYAMSTDPMSHDQCDLSICNKKLNFDYNCRMRDVVRDIIELKYF